MNFLAKRSKGKRRRKGIVKLKNVIERKYFIAKKLKGEKECWGQGLMDK